MRTETQDPYKERATCRQLTNSGYPPLLLTNPSMGGRMFVTKVTRLSLAWLRTRVKRTQPPTRRSCKLSASRTYDQWNLYETATRRTVAAQYSAYAASMEQSVKTQRVSSNKLTLQRRQPVNEPEAKLGQHKCR